MKAILSRWHMVVNFNGSCHFGEVTASSSKAHLKFSDEPFPGAFCLSLLSTESTGSTYGGKINNRDMTGWLCPVFFHYIKKAPGKLYVQIKRG